MPAKKKVSPKSEVVEVAVEVLKGKSAYITSLHRNESDSGLYTAVFSDGTIEDKYVGDIEPINEAFADKDWQVAAVKAWKAV